ncbi:TPA: hypothetical protein KO307_003103 [Clostridioides difficile]|nr:hypothetical protein [Clostridioides difficile]
MDIKDIKESFQKKPIGWISGVLIIAIIIIPLIVTFTISVRNPIFNFNESNGWLGFWGSYLGGILGGLATLVAVVITTNQTRKIQEDNTTETRKIQEDNIERMKREDKIRRKRIFADDIMECIVKYLAEISECFYNKQKSRTVSREMYFILQIKLNNIEYSVLQDDAYKILVLIEKLDKKISILDEKKFNEICKKLIYDTRKFVYILKMEEL